MKLCPSNVIKKMKTSQQFASSYFIIHCNIYTSLLELKLTHNTSLKFGVRVVNCEFRCPSFDLFWKFRCQNNFATTCNVLTQLSLLYLSKGDSVTFSFKQRLQLFMVVEPNFVNLDKYQITTTLNSSIANVSFAYMYN